MLVHASPEVGRGSMAPAVPVRRARRPDDPSTARVLDLQRLAGNAAVTHQLARRAPLPAGQAGNLQVQRCGPMPCNCSDDERADHAARHPEDQAEDPDPEVGRAEAPAPAVQRRPFFR